MLVVSSSKWPAILFVVNGDHWIMTYIFCNLIKAVNWKQTHQFSAQVKVCTCDDLIVTLLQRHKIRGWFTDALLKKKLEKQNKQVYRSIRVVMLWFVWLIGTKWEKSVFRRLQLETNRSYLVSACLLKPGTLPRWFSSLARQGVSFRQRSDEREPVAWSKIKESRFHLNTTSLCNAVFISIYLNLTACNSHNCIAQLSSTAIKALIWRFNVIKTTPVGGSSSSSIATTWTCWKRSSMTCLVTPLLPLVNGIGIESVDYLGLWRRAWDVVLLRGVSWSCAWS